MKRALIITSVASMVDQFIIPSIGVLQDLGYTVDVACNFLHGSTCSDEKIEALKQLLAEMGVVFHQIDFSRSVVRFGQNNRALQQIRVLLKSQHYDLVHCHSPIGGLLTRVAVKAHRKNGTKVLYTAHGFHFFKGAPLKNWLLFYPIEWLCSFWTDVLITINHEDYQRAQKRLHAKKTEYIPGVGIDCERFFETVADRSMLPEIPEESFIVFSVGELNENKNHETVIRAIAELHDPTVRYMIAGQGDRLDLLQKLAISLGVEKQVYFLGYRRDVDRLYHLADLFILPSFREGLNVSLMEAMASGLPVIGSEIRGNRDLIRQDEGGFLVPPGDVGAYVSAIRQIRQDPGAAKKMGEFNAVFAQRYDVECVDQIMKKIYEEII